MQHSGDLIADVLARVRHICPEFSDEMACVVDRESRADWGGTEPYIAKNPPHPPQRIIRAEADLTIRSGGSVAAASTRLGVHRSTIYRLLKKR